MTVPARVMIGLVGAVGALLWLATPATRPAKAAAFPRSIASLERFADDGDEWRWLERTYPTGRTPGSEKMERVWTTIGGRAARPRLALPGDQWTSIGPQPINYTTSAKTSGRIVTIAAHPTDPNIVYIGADGGGIWKTVDGGATWSLLTNDLPYPAINAVYLDPVTPSIVYAVSSNGIYPGRLLRSVDAGASWQLITPATGAGDSVQAIGLRLDPLHAGSPSTTRLYLFDDQRNVLRSDDGGRTVREVLHTAAADPAASEFTLDARVDPKRADRVSVVTAAPGCSGCTTADVTLMLHRSSDAGAHWSQQALVHLGATAIPATRLTIAPSNPDVQVVAFLDGSAGRIRVLRSSNGGETWAELPALPKPASLAWPISTAFAPDDPNTIVVGNLDVLRSTDGGQSWTALQAPHVDEAVVAFDAGRRLLLGSDGGFFRSDRIDANWTGLNNGLSITECYSIAAHPQYALVFAAGTQDNGTVQFLASGGWSLLTGADGGDVAFDPTGTPSQTIAYTETEWLHDTSGPFFQFYRCQSIVGCVERTTGLNKGDGAPFIPRFAIDASNPQTLMLTAERLYRTTNRGNSWTVASPSIKDNQRCWQDPALGRKCASAQYFTTVAIAPSSSAIAYSGALNGDIWTTTNGGNSWSSVAGPNAGPLPVRKVSEIAVDPSSPAVAYAAFSGFASSGSGQGHVFRTQDGGQTWRDLSGSLPDIPVNALLIDPESTPRTLYAGTDVGIYRLVDNGAEDWQPYGTGLPPVTVTRLAYTRATRTLAAATYGRGVWIISDRVSR